jgi:imidazolonepropionase
MPLLRNIGVIATCAYDGGQGELHLVREAALAWQGDTILWVGPEAELPAEHAALEALDAGGRLVIPGLVDCHTHLAFGGWRAAEFEQRLLGRSYLEIAAAGGGIASTVRATREISEEELETRCLRFLEAMVRLGITTVEAKSGYGLSVAEELKLLRVYRALAAHQRVRIVPTLLAAHTIPPEFRGDRAGYVDLIIRELIPEVAREKLAACCDVFIEETAFTVAEARRILEAARDAGFALKVHADQLTSSGGAELAAELGALSADHLEHVSEGGIAALARAGVVAVSLPIATLYLGQPPMPARRLIEAGAHVAVATDFNPGSAPSYHLPLAMMLACTLQRMTPAEVLKGATIYAAQAIGVSGGVGALRPGKSADFAVIDASDVTHWLYHFRPNACVMTVIRGEVVWRAEA